MKLNIPRGTDHVAPDAARLEHGEEEAEEAGDDDGGRPL